MDHSIRRQITTHLLATSLITGSGAVAFFTQQLTERLFRLEERDLTWISQLTRAGDRAVDQRLQVVAEPTVRRVDVPLVTVAASAQDSALRSANAAKEKLKTEAKLEFSIDKIAAKAVSYQKKVITLTKKLKLENKQLLQLKFDLAQGNDSLEKLAEERMALEPLLVQGAFHWVRLSGESALAPVKEVSGIQIQAQVDEDRLLGFKNAQVRAEALNRDIQEKQLSVQALTGQFQIASKQVARLSQQLDKARLDRIEYLYKVQLAAREERKPAASMQVASVTPVVAKPAESTSKQEPTPQLPVVPAKPPLQVAQSDQLAIASVDTVSTQSEVSWISTKERTLCEYSKCEYSVLEGPIKQVVKEGITQSARQTEAGWWQASSDEYWDAYWYQPLNQESSVAKPAVPMLREAHLKVLSKLVNTQVHPDRAVLFGKIKDDWEVEYSSRSAKPLYLKTGAGTKEFFILNAEPGAGILTIKTTDPLQKVAVAILAFPHASTWLGTVTDFTKQDLRLTLSESSEEEQLAPKAIEVRILGQTSAVVTGHSNEKGNREVQFLEVPILKGYPLFVEVRDGTRFPHRYKIDPQDPVTHRLFLTDAAFVEATVSQLQGGISAKSGIILGAARQTVSKLIRSGEKIHEFFPKATALLGELMPEAYALDQEGQILVNRPLYLKSPRYVAVEVPAGGVRIDLENRRGNSVWSDWTVASPGVVSLIGP